MDGDASSEWVQEKLGDALENVGRQREVLRFNLGVGGRKLRVGTVVVEPEPEGASIYAPFMGYSHYKLSVHLGSGQIHVESNKDPLGTRRDIPYRGDLPNLDEWRKLVWKTPVHGHDFFFVEVPPWGECAEVDEERREVTITTERSLVGVRPPRFGPWALMEKLSKSHGKWGFCIGSERTGDVLVSVPGAEGDLIFPLPGKKNSPITQTAIWKQIWEPILGGWRELDESLKEDVAGLILRKNRLTEEELQGMSDEYEAQGEETRRRLGIGRDGRPRK